MKKDYYEILGISKNASEKDIKKAYRKLAIEHHPDKTKGDSKSESLFKEINEAYQTLSDSEKKTKYDMYGHDYANTNRQSNQNYNNMHDIFNMYRGFNTRQETGKPMSLNIKLDLEDIINGVTKKIKLNKKVHCNGCNATGSKTGKVTTCTTCHGQGVVLTTQQSIFGMVQAQTICPTCNGTGSKIVDPCNICHGQGIVDGSDTIDIQIPKGVSEEMQLKISNQGNACKNKGLNGDIIINFTINKHTDFTIKNLDIICTKHINIADMIFGCKLSIDYIGSKLSIDIPAYTQSGKTFQLKGKGIPNVNNNYDIGNLLVTVQVNVPRVLSNHEIELLKEIQKSPNF